LKVLKVADVDVGKDLADPEILEIIQNVLADFDPMQGIDRHKD
jgi:hypothetical protein